MRTMFNNLCFIIAGVFMIIMMIKFMMIKDFENMAICSAICMLCFDAIDVKTIK